MLMLKLKGKCHEIHRLTAGTDRSYLLRYGDPYGLNQSSVHTSAATTVFSQLEGRHNHVRQSMMIFKAP